MDTNLKDLKGFKPITVAFSKNTASHTMFMKEHSVRNQQADTPVGRTMYLLNIPPWLPGDVLGKAFNLAIDFVKCLPYKDVNASGFKFAFIVFSSENALCEALKLNTLPAISTIQNTIKVGLEKWIHEYNTGLLQQSTRKEEMLQIIKDYDAEELKSKQKASGETDDDGWTVVTKKGRKPGLSRKESVNEKIMGKSKKEKVLKNFYRHQIRQAKRDQLAALRKKAEEDKKKILALKQRRAFKPF